ncbi:MAG: HD-GYP domain-containing protein, partial [Spirochaetaceae bacterium]|nr:HD-GYP domain-containing protein [Spirochaetaceae bacterium]
QAFVQCMGIFPIGSYVLLNTGEIAKVVEANPTAPLCPKTEILEGKTMPDGEGAGNIAKATKVFIVRALTHTEVSKYVDENHRN